MVLEHKPLIVDVNAPSVEEAERLLDRLPRRGLCFNARFAPEVVGDRLTDMPGGEMWVLSPEHPA